jgi:outer membrane lipoprotein-sorting protein
MNILRRLPLSRLLLLCALVIAIGVSATAIALGVSNGPTPPSKPLADAVHDALLAPPVAGVSARIQLTNHLIEGASLAGGGNGGEAGQLASSPLLSGASGRLWLGADGRTRLELQSEKGDTQILYDGHTVSLYDASTNTLYRYTPTTQDTAAGGNGSDTSSGTSADHHQVPTVAQIQEAIAHASQHATLSGAVPTDIAGQAAYTTRISPSKDGGLIGGAELSWDAVHGVPLRAAIYSSTSPSPVIELAASEISYGPVASSTLDFTPPANAKIEEVSLPKKPSSGSGPSGQHQDSGSAPKVNTHGQGLAGITVIEEQSKSAGQQPSSSALEGLPKVQINGVAATELPTALGTLLSFERSGIRYLLVGSVTPSAIEAFARGL